MKLRLIITTILIFYGSTLLNAQEANNMIHLENSPPTATFIFILFIGLFLAIIWHFLRKFKIQVSLEKKWGKETTAQRFSSYISSLNSNQITEYLKVKRLLRSKNKPDINKGMSTIILILFSSLTLSAQNNTNPEKGLFGQGGIIITLILILIPVLLGSIFAIVKAINAFKIYNNQNKLQDSKQFAENLIAIEDEELESTLLKRKAALDYTLSNYELSGKNKAEDTIGIIQNASPDHQVHFTAQKKKAIPRPSLDKDITKLILWYLGCAAFWLVLGGTIGEYVGIKFVSPDADHISWLSFGRLRPVHTNMVFWGWASLGIIGLGYYVVPTVSNAKIHNIKWGWNALWLINAMVIFGTISLMAGINNGGGEFREYIWPIMALFAVALILTLLNFLKTVAKRTTKEIYISNWYIISSIIFTIIIALTAYLPFWQNGISETIIQGYYMHSGVGMWFTLYTLGLLYYFIPQQLNRPIYAYSLGILAFWTQILFYTIIGTHHFVFSAIPWWLQTVAIVGSGGMIIPVVAATINYFFTFKGQWKKVSNSYTLPFFFVAVMYYFIVSMQGTAEAFKFTNLLWHFTDFTVGHSHLGFYGIITFAIWGGTYTIVPRLTGIEPQHHIVGAHFWLAFIGLLFYAIPLSIGGTLKGMMWMEGKPFIDSVVMMFDYWLWRAIGGSLMFLAHFVFAYNFYKMTRKPIAEIDIKEEAIKHLKSITGN
ncbi:MAG: cbb3-type cytochrome c oxidase subunit I [Bacteroidota bacterium]|nr:cbb3-type cytochrome c oxidase subunit I [Bacteroidota bacterium]MDP3144585.1 cbb3-type cytochrome c oxidase subunit I [Bacteroidota bacterium]